MPDERRRHKQRDDNYTNNFPLHFSGNTKVGNDDGERDNTSSFSVLVGCKISWIIDFGGS